MIIGSIVLLLFLIGVAGISSFNSSVEKEKTALFNSKRGDQKITKNHLKNLPNLIKNHLIKTGILGKPKYCNATFKQTGMIKTNPEKNWLSFTAIQYMSSNNPGFIWTAKALPMLIRDKYINHRGEVKVSLLGLKNLILFTGQKVDQSSLGRYLGELIWFPMGFLDPDISWQTIDSKTIKATITKNSQVLDGLFIFNQNGMIDLFKTKRYRDIELENFIGEVGEYQEYDGLLIPNKMTATWDSKEGKQEYFKADIKGYTLL